MQRPLGEGSPMDSPAKKSTHSNENLTGFERASQEIEKASQESSPPKPKSERRALTEIRKVHDRHFGKYHKACSNGKSVGS